MKKKFHILIVDDDDGILLLLKAYLEAREYIVDTCLSGEEAIQKVKKQDYDIILLDILLPNEDGFIVLRSIKKIKAYKYIPIIMFTASERKDHRVSCFENGADDFIPKPLDFIELEIRIKSLLRIKTQHDKLDPKHTQLKQANYDTFYMLALSCEARDRDTGAHIRRIEHICTAFAQELGLSDRKIEDIAYASMLHDIGKVKIPDNILKKPGQLSPDEWTIMKKHTLFGFELLEKKKIFQTARHITRFHHERWDGTGYPDGLVEDQIPLAARICAVADVYDALTHKRVYKEAWLEEEAFEDMRNKFGNHFDPQLKPIFEKLYYNRILHRFAKQFRDQEKYE